MKKVLPYLWVMLIFGLVLNLSLPSYQYVNTHDEDDNVVSGFLMAQDYVMSRDIFSHHLPGAYLISETLERTFRPTTTDQSVVVHRSFVTIWNCLWALVLVGVWGVGTLWLVVVLELLRASYLYSLFHAENLVVYPMVYLLLTLFGPSKIRPILSGLAVGLITVLLAPLWPLSAISGIQFWWINRRKPGRLAAWLIPVLMIAVWVVVKIDVGEFGRQFFGYNALTYAPMLIKKPLLYTAAAVLAPGMVMWDWSFSTKVVMIQLLSLSLFVFDFKKTGLKTIVAFGVLLAIIGFRSTPRFDNPSLDFHVLPWVAALAGLCWYKFFVARTSRGAVFVIVLFLPVVFLLSGRLDFFPTNERVGKMVIRYGDTSPIVAYLKSEKKEEETLFTLPAHTLLYRQVGVKPFNKYLFFLPWMEKSPILFSELNDSFMGGLPTFVFIDTIHFPYTPPEEVAGLLKNYAEVKIVEGEPPVYVLKSR